MPFTNKSRGFSMIELFVVIGIAAIIGTMARSSQKLFRARAMQTEANVSLKMIRTSIENFYDAQNAFPTLQWVGALYDDGSGSPDFCNRPTGPGNELSFKITSCNKTRYGYAAASVPGNELWYGAASGGTVPAAVYTVAFPLRENKIAPGCDKRDLTVFVKKSDMTEMMNIRQDAAKACY